MKINWEKFEKYEKAWKLFTGQFDIFDSQIYCHCNLFEWFDEQEIYGTLILTCGMNSEIYYKIQIKELLDGLLKYDHIIKSLAVTRSEAIQECYEKMFKILEDKLRKH